jgi:hypothetical protein
MNTIEKYNLTKQEVLQIVWEFYCGVPYSGLCPDIFLDEDGSELDEWVEKKNEELSKQKIKEFKKIYG